MDEQRPTEQHQLHFAFGARRFANQDLSLHVGDRTYSLQRHSAKTRTTASGDNPFVSLLSESGVSHFVDAELPRDAIASIQITRSAVIDGQPVDAIVALAIHVPREGRRNELQSELRAGSNDLASLHPKLAWHRERYGTLKTARPMLSAAAEQPDLLYDVLNPFDTASALLFYHPSLVNLNAENGGAIPQFILRECIGRALQQRSLLVERIRELGAKWSWPVQLMDDGTPVRDEKGDVIYGIDVDDRVKRVMADPLGIALRLSTQAPNLERYNWTRQYGQTSADVEPAPAPRKLLRATQTKWKMKSLTSLWGVSFDSVDYDEPRAGGWSVTGTWSADDPATPMPANFVADFVAGRAVVVVDMPGKPGASRIEVPAAMVSDGIAIDHQIRFGSLLPGGVDATLTLRLNGLRTDLRVGASTLAGAPSQVHIGSRRNGQDVMLWSCTTPGNSVGEIRVTARNYALRHLSAYAEFFNANGEAIAPGVDLADLPGALRALFDSHRTKRFVDVIPPIDMIFGAPLPADSLTLRIPFPEGASKMRLYWGGIGSGPFDPTVCSVGVTATVIFEMALPIMLLAIGTSEQATGTVNSILSDTRVLFGIVVVVSAGVGGYIGVSQDPGRAAKTVAVKLLPALLKTGLKYYLVRKQAEGVAKRSVPLVNLAFLAFDVASTAMQLLQTSVALAQSPAVYDIEITRTFDLHLTITPDPEFGRFPDYHDEVRVLVMHDSGATLTESTLPKLPSGPVSKPITWHYEDCASGGRIKVLVFFYAANMWRSGMGSSGWVDAKGADGKSAREVRVQIKNVLIPLTTKSVYQHRDVMVFESGKHAWKQLPAPATTRTTKAPDPRRQVMSLGGITVAQRPGLIGYSWQATGLGLPRDRPTATRTNEPLYVAQNLSALEEPSSREAMTAVGFSARTAVAYDLTCPDDATGRSFYLDPSRGDFDADKNPDGGCHVRRIALSSTTTPVFEAGSRQSWGRFPKAVDSFVYHPQGYVAGITAGADKILIIRIPDASVDDRDAPLSYLASGDGKRDGLISRPRAIAVALDGRLLVLEDGNRRIQSFDLGGNPVPYFGTAGGPKSPILPLRETGGKTTYLDLSVEAKGYLFVLAFDGDGARAEQYRVDIYEPGGSFLVSTPGVAAGKIAVDLARAMYTLNWQTLEGPGGRPEPSISQWLAPPPSVAGRPPGRGS
jgi:hypothetical protein